MSLRAHGLPLSVTKARACWASGARLDGRAPRNCRGFFAVFYIPARARAQASATSTPADKTAELGNLRKTSDLSPIVACRYGVSSAL